MTAPPPQPVGELQTRVLWRFWGGMLALAVLLAAEWAISQATELRHDRVAELVNASGRQRMLSQRVAALVHRVAAEPDSGQRRIYFDELQAVGTQLLAATTAAAGQWETARLPSGSARFVTGAIETARPALDGGVVPAAALTRIDHEADRLTGLFDTLLGEVVAETREAYERGFRLRVVLGVAGMLVLLALAVLVLWPLLRRLGEEKEILEDLVARRTRALRESESTQRLILDSIDDTMLLVDVEGICLAVNTAAARDLARPPGLIIGRSLTDLLPPAAAETHMSYLDKVVRVRGPMIFEEVREARHLRVRMHPIIGAGGVIKGITVVGRDITERRRAELRLRESEERYRTIVETAREGIWVLDGGGLTTFVNRRMSEMLGADRGRLLATPFSGLLAEGDAGAVWRRLAAKDDDGAGDVQELPLRRVDGGTVWAALVGAPIHDHDGRLAGVVVLATDITRRRHDKEVIRREKERAENYLRLAGTIILALDLDGRVTLINAKGCEVVGRAEEDILGRDWIAEFVAPEQRGPVADLFRRLRAEAAGLSTHEEVFEHDIIAADGSRRTVAWRNVATRDRAGRVEGTLSSGDDVTERFQAEAQRQAVEFELHQTQKMDALGQLAGGMAHEFNNLLVPMIGLAETALAEAPETGRLRRNLASIIQAGLRARDLVRKVLSFSRVDADAGPATTEACGAIDDGRHLLEATLTPSVRLNLRLPDGPVPVAVSAAELHQILMNLGGNARDALAGRRRPEVRVRLLTTHLRRPALTAAGRLGAGGYAVLVVRDNGEGMTGQTMHRIFEPFFTTKGVGLGTGMGLAVVHGIVVRCMGGIAVFSRPGVGTTFKIYLPLAPEP